MDEDGRVCPNSECGEPLKRNKKGHYPKYCPECDSPTDVVTVQVDKEVVQPCHNVDCGVILEKTNGVYPKSCPKCSEPVERRRQAAAQLNTDLPETNSPPARVGAEETIPLFIPDGQGLSSQSFITSHEPEKRDGNELIARVPEAHRPPISQHLACQNVTPTPTDPEHSTQSHIYAEKPDITCSQMPTGSLTTSTETTSRPPNRGADVMEGSVTGKAVSDEIVICPFGECRAERKRNKKGQLARFCKNCKFDFLQAATQEDASITRPQAPEQLTTQQGGGGEPMAFESAHFAVSLPTENLNSMTISDSWEHITEKEAECGGTNEKSCKPVKRTAENMSDGDQSANKPVSKSQKTPEKEMSRLSINNDEKASLDGLQLSTATNSAVRTALFFGEDSQPISLPDVYSEAADKELEVDASSSSGDEYFDAEENEGSGDGPLKNVPVAHHRKSSSGLVDPTLAPYLPDDVRNVLPSTKPMVTQSHRTTLVFVPKPNIESSPAPSSSTGGMNPPKPPPRAGRHPSKRAPPSSPAEVFNQSGTVMKQSSKSEDHHFEEINNLSSMQNDISLKRITTEKSPEDISLGEPSDTDHEGKESNAGKTREDNSTSSTLRSQSQDAGQDLEEAAVKGNDNTHSDEQKSASDSDISISQPAFGVLSKPEGFFNNQQQGTSQPQYPGYPVRDYGKQSPVQETGPSDSHSVETGTDADDDNASYVSGTEKVTDRKPDDAAVSVQDAEGGPAARTRSKMQDTDHPSDQEHRSDSMKDEPTDEDIVVLFDNLLSKVEEANQRLGGMKKTKAYVDNAGEAKLHKALADGRERRKYYYGNLNTWRNSGSAAPSQQVIESINRMRKYINTYSMELNGLFLKLGLAPLKVLEVPSSKRKDKSGSQDRSRQQSQQATVTFKMVLSTAIQKLFESEGRTPVVDIRCDIDQFKQPLLAMEHSENDVWVATWKPPANCRILQYKYFIHDLSGEHDEGYEWLGETSWKKTINRFLDVASLKEDTVIYDGVVLMKDNSGYLQKAGSFIKSIANIATYKEEELKRGVKAMLPDWVNELKDGKTVEELYKQITSTLGRHYIRLNGFSSFIHGHAGNPYAAKNSVDKVRRDYVTAAFDSHKKLIESSQNYGLALCSLIGLLDIGRYRYENPSAIEMNIEKVAALVATTVSMWGHAVGEGKVDLDLMRQTFSHQTTYYKNLADAVKRTMTWLQEHYSVRYSWIWLLPVFHLLTGTLELTTQGSVINDDSWWGIDQLKRIVTSHQKTFPDDGDWRLYIRQLALFFELDKILPYSFLGLLTDRQLYDMLQCADVDEVMQLPVDGVLACARYHAGHCYQRQGIIENLLGYLLRKRSTKWFVMDKDDKAVDLTRDMLATLLPNYANEVTEASLLAVQIYLHLMDGALASDGDCDINQMGAPLMIWLATFKQVYDRSTVRRSVSYFDYALKIFRTRYETIHDLPEKEIKQWQQLFRFGAENGLLSEWWHGLCQKVLKNRLTWVADKSEESVIDLYCTHNTHIPIMDETVAEVAFPKAEKLLTKDNAAWLNANPEKVGKLIDRALTNLWDSNDESDMSIVKNMVKWGNFLSVWKFYVKIRNQNQLFYISNDNVDRLIRSQSALENVMDCLVKGVIKFSDFAYLSDNEQRVIDLCEISDELTTYQASYGEIFRIRRSEREAFHKFHRLLAGFWSTCKLAVADRAAIDAWLERETDSLEFTHAVHPSTGKVFCDCLPDEIRFLLNEFENLMDRVIFNHAFHRCITKAAPGPAKDIKVLFETAKASYDEELDRLAKGTISISQMERLVNIYFGDNHANFMLELSKMLEKDVFTERRGQIDLCSHLDQYHKGARVVMGLKEKFNITGNFEDLERILESADKRLQLKDISPKLVKSAESIKEINQAQIECLDAFLSCGELIDWIRREVPKKDISNFVDLASSTLGEDDHAALKTRYLLNALTGYSPLIYDLSPDGTDYISFIEICRKVWEAQTNNNHLITNLTSSNSELEWLKKVKTHFGNVEMKSIAQATSINEEGLYFIGNIPDYSKDFKALDDVIQLKCDITDKEKTESKTYSYSQLKELQSKLTLVAGEKQDENKDAIKRFDAMRDAVENLARAYIDIRREGCIQFDDMLVVVHCNPNHRLAVEVRLVSIGVSMIAFNKAKDPIAHCQDLYRYLKDCITKWRQSMDMKRSDHPELNFYTTEQLVVLRKELGTFLDNHSPQILNQALPLLAMIQPVIPEQLLQLINSYNPGGTVEAAEEKEDTMDDGNTFITYDKMSYEQKELVDAVMEEHEDFDEMLAVQCMNELEEPITLDTMFEWIEQHKHKQKQIQEDQTRQAKVDGDSGKQTSTQLMKKIMADQPKSADLMENLGKLYNEFVDNTRPSLMDDLKKLWAEFIENTKQSIKNFLGIPQLGHVLEQISKLKERPLRERKVQPWLRRGAPCLIPTPQSKVYQTVLSIYEYDGKYTYPTRNEVLLCNEKTTVEEVRLFLSRALNDPLSFYCMVNCHLLSYDVCRCIETRLTNTADDTVKSYGLAFIYAEEKRDARIRAYLDKHLVKNVVLSTPPKLRKYVQKILTVPEDVLSACSVDLTKSCSRLIRSKRAGVGKSLKKFNLLNEVRRNKQLKGSDITIPIYKTIDTDSIIARLNTELGNGYTDTPHHTIHVDIAHEVETGADELLFNLIILRSVVNSEGVVWQLQPTQYYIIECMPYTRNQDKRCAHEVMDYLPTTWCITPQEAATAYASRNVPKGFNGFDAAVLREEEWQMVIKYLVCKHQNDRQYQRAEGLFENPLQALELLIGNCGLYDPTWSELRHYVYFLSNQLRKVETSPFCGQAFAEDLPGFRAFVIEFMFRMAKDFATRSLKIAEETPGLNLHEAQEQGGGDVLEQLEMKRTWESGNHPYLFFNEDGETFSPLGFFVENRGGHALSLVDCQTREMLVPNCMPTALKQTLDRYQLPMSEDFNTLTRPAQLRKLRDIMVKTVMYSREVEIDDETTEIQEEPMFVGDDDPDPNYVLTMDNAKKILAIHQRLRVEIPVIIMGETGCGKTKLIDFMSKLQVPTALKEDVDTMIIVKIHGGTTEEDIINKVNEAQNLAKQNQERCAAYAAEFDSSQVPTIYTVLFLDEANTTEAIGLVKEILCDGRIRGKPLETGTGLKIIAACNPYRRHSDEMIEKLKKAGLGYNVGEDETKDKFGQIPMRHLVYRVQALSQSLLPLVWDFGTLKSRTDDGVDVECAYIRQMIIKFNQSSEEGGLNFGPHTALVAEILTMTQSFMRDQKDECSFVSLRDIQRLLDVSNWFYKQRRYLFPAIDGLDEDEMLLDVEEEEDAEPSFGQRDYSTRSLILAIGVCYLARLEDETRGHYAEHIGGRLEELIGGEGMNGAAYLFYQIERCQDMFIQEVIDRDQHVNIAQNKALKENIFMMIICIENRIPLFVVGKPGSSKSLSKSMVIDAMKGNSSKKELFKRMKRTYTVSFQCSRHATPAGIVGVFNHCANFQKGQDLDKFVSVVVLDEVGLAEDSENMPLKTLHPLLEDGCEGNQKPEDWMKCAFVGISNWALDPAKMNRGIFVQRGTPHPDELVQIANEICRSSRNGTGVGPFISQLAKGYLAICDAEKPEERDLTEFFGLRDFYSLMKMLVNFAGRTGQLNRNQLEHSIRRNFGGFDPETGFDPMVIFTQFCPTLDTLAMQADRRPPIDSIGLIESSLSGEDNLVRSRCDVCGKVLDRVYALPCRDHFVGQCCKEQMEAALGRREQPICTVDDCATPIPIGYKWTPENRIESRYLLILTENLSVLSIILDKFKSSQQQPEVVFGSKFPEDVSYTQVCHNIYRIKTCMDMGKPVILLNLDDLYESLYDALNQYFSTWGDRKFVDLGLGTHRVKTFVNDNFRLVVIADKNKVLSEFPIPLINRLEKHYVSATSLLERQQKEIKKALEKWTGDFVKPQRIQEQRMCPGECDMCNEKLEKPYALPCRRHYVGPCCKEQLERKLETKQEEDEESVKCEVEGCDTVIPGNWKWEVDTVALENRQYFENSTKETSFIGYSSECTALSVLQATDDINAQHSHMENRELDDKHWEKVYERSKFYLLLCATGESVMRLDKTELAHEARTIQDIYLHHQYHETLLQYLENEFNLCGGQSLFVQVTSFAELMGAHDVMVLYDNLNTLGTKQVEVKNMYLRDFAKEDQFTDSIRSFYVKPSEYSTKLLIVQCEAADENTELLDSVRFILQREKEIADDTVHSILLLNLPRGRNFTGYQGGKWKCVHIDDPRSPDIKLPSLSRCMKLKPSEIIARLLPAHQPQDQQHAYDEEPKADDEAMEENAARLVENMETGVAEEKMDDDDGDDDDEMPPLEDDNPQSIADDEYPDVEMGGEQHNPVPAPRLPRRAADIRERKDEYEGLMSFILQCLPPALSVIMVDCKYDRANLLRRILEHNRDFREIFLRHVHYLLKKQEEISISHWVKADAAKASNMKQSETMRHALEDSLERALVPALAAVISFVDVRMNLALMEDRGTRADIWLQVFDQCGSLGLNVDPQTQKLPKSFRIHQAGEGPQTFNTQFPYSWLVKSSIDKLINDVAGMNYGFEQLAELVTEQFSTQSPIGRVVHGKQDLLDNYIKDFVYLSHPCASKDEHNIVGMSIMSYLMRKQIQNIGIVHVHLAYMELRTMFASLSEILSLAWRNEDGSNSNLVGKVKDELKATLNQMNDCDLVALRCLLVYLTEIKLNVLLTFPEMWVDGVDKSKHIIAKVLGQRQEENDVMADCRTIWSKLMLKKLFVEHVIIPTEPVERDGQNKRKPHKLSFFINKVTGVCFQEFDSFNQVVNWLRETVIEGVQALYKRCPRQCPICKEPLHSPVRLPCGHMICDTCVNEVKLCPDGECDGRIPEGFVYNPANDHIDDSKLNELKDLRKRLNKFFMAFVSEVVFGPDVEPDEEILQWLLQCVTFGAGTRVFSLYNTADVIDPTPVLRSFLLKLLMQCNKSEHVQEHLNRLLAEWGDDVRQKIQTMVLLMDCKKDFYSPTVSINDVFFADAYEELVTSRVNVPNIDMLNKVSELQCLLSYGVTALDLRVPQQATEDLEEIEATLRQFILAAAQNGNTQPGYYTARLLLASQGESFIKDLLNTPHNYLIPDVVKRDLESFTVPDVLFVYGGQEYRAAKTAIDEVIAMSGNQDEFTNAVNQLTMACRTPWLLLEIIFTRVTRTFVQRTPVPQNVTNGLWEHLNIQLQGKHHDMLGMLLRDGGLPREMDVSSAQGINLTMLVLSLLDCMSNNTAMGDLNPLSELINQPLQAFNHFLPTMVDDQYEAQAENIRRALQKEGENPVPYACPNGHPYYIGDCGRPAINARCMDCGQPIGGEEHRLAAANRKLDGGHRAQRSRPGHILGAANQQGGAATSERDLNVLSCSVMRCLVHLCMYAGSVFNPQHVIQVVQGIQLREDDHVRQFLEAHIQSDIQQISRSSGENVDDCILLLHELINRMKRAAQQGGNLTLTSIQQRKAWEAQFDNSYIKPTFGNNKAIRLHNVKQQLLTADNVDLRRILSIADKPIDEANILASPGLWEYKQTLTLPRVQNHLAPMPSKNFPTLRHIVNNCDAISAVRYLPDILELMRIFSDKFHSRFKRDKASKLQIGDFITKYKEEASNIEALVDSFIAAWNIMAANQRMIGREFDDMEITSPLSSFLLDQHSRRFAENKPSPPFTLIIYLIDVQNRLLSSDEESLQTLEMSSINSSHVVTLGNSEELIGVILSHSEYEMRETTRVTYNWQAIERELVMRYRTNRPILDFKPEQLQFYVFQEDFNLHNQLKSISDSQEWLSLELHASVSAKLTPRVPTLTANLKDLKVAINFLYGTKIEEDKSLAEYMQSFAKDQLLSYLPDSIKLRHVRDVWLLLKFTQTDLLMRQHQEPFDDIDTECREPLTPQLEEILRECCMYNSPRTKVLLQELFKYIILRLNKAAVSENELNTDRSLDEELKVFIEVSANTKADDERMKQILADIPDLVKEPMNEAERPPMIQVKHAPRAWCFIWTRYTTKVE